MVPLDSNIDVLTEFVFIDGQLRAIKYRQSVNSRFKEMKFCATDPDGYAYDYTIFDMVDLV